MDLTQSDTLTLQSVRPGGKDAGPGPQLVLQVVSCPLAPQRVGELLVPTGATTHFGRASPGPGKLGLVRRLGGEARATRALEVPYLSRQQLSLTRQSRTAIDVGSPGRCPMRVNGQRLSEATLVEGDVLELEQHLLLLAVQARPTLAEQQRLPRHAFGRADEHGLVGESDAAWGLRDAIQRAARSGVHVLVRGPSGVGKELISQAIHRASARSAGRLVARSAATLPEGLVSAELFGNAANYPNAGARPRPGLVGEADSGTLFLDEIGELPEAAQAALLRVLDQGDYQRLGESRQRRTDLRLVGATNQPLTAFRADLLARMPLVIEIPGLPARRGDIPLLARHLLRDLARRDPMVKRVFIGDQPRMSTGFVHALLRHPFTTHVRELRRLLLAGLTLNPGNVLDEPPAAPPPSPTQGLTPERIQQVLDKHGGKQAAAWKELGLTSRHALARLIKKHGLRTR